MWTALLFSLSLKPTIKTDACDPQAKGICFSFLASNDRQVHASYKEILQDQILWEGVTATFLQDAIDLLILNDKCLSVCVTEFCNLKCSPVTT